MTRGPVLLVPMPVCPKCHKPVTAMLCQAAPRTAEDVAAIQALLLDMHDRLAHPQRPAGCVCRPGEEWHHPITGHCADCGCAGERTQHTPSYTIPEP